MPNSPPNPQSPPKNPQNPNTQKRICDFCSEKVALLYCKADNAKLCLSCDREVHSTNQLFTKHTRFQLCDNCDLYPASIHCFTEHSVLCQNCDYDVHSCHGSSLNHDRRPLEGFSGCPSVFELSSFVGCGDFDAKSLVLSEQSVNKGFNGGLFGGIEDENVGFCDFFAWDLPTTMVSLDDLIVSTDKSHHFQDMVVPPLPKDRNLSCGQHKHEILRQLCELSKSEPDLQMNANPIVGHHVVPDEDEKESRVRQNIRSSHHYEEHPALQGNEASPHNWCVDDREGINDVFLPSSLLENHLENSALKSETPSGICSSLNHATNGWDHQYPISNESPEISKKVSIRELVSADRDSALSRYKEKKRTRRFEKHIRYESRKLQAENRTRIKGRFAKVDNRGNQT